MTSRLLAVTIFASACASAPQSNAMNSDASSLRLVRPEEVVHPPVGANWPRPAGATRTHGPRYPTGPRKAGVEERVLAAFVIDQQGSVEYRTISLVQPLSQPDFYRSVCDFLRWAQFDWQPHAPVRGFVVMRFEFTLGNIAVTSSLPPAPNIDAMRSELAQLPPPQLAQWIESRPHCS